MLQKTLKKTIFFRIIKVYDYEQRRPHMIDTFADYILEEEDLASKMEIVY